MQTILDTPGDDSLRLIAADACEEQGDLARSEFMRVQLELAWYELPSGMSGRQDALLQRERELLSRNAKRWCADLPPADHFGGCFDHVDGCVRVYWGMADQRYKGWYERGFLGRVECTLACWCGEACRQCLGHGSYRTTVAHDGRLVRHYDCDVCQGTGRVGGHGPVIVGLQPVTRVALTDWEPRAVGGGAEPEQWDVWTRADPDVSDPAHSLPHELWLRLRGAVNQDFPTSKDYDSAQDLRDDVNRVLLAWAKASAVKLPLGMRKGEAAE